MSETIEQLRDRILESMNRATNLEDGGPLTQDAAKEVWGETSESLLELVERTTPFSTIGNDARRGMVVATLKSGGKAAASRALAGLITGGNISPSLCEELMKLLR